MRRALLSLCCVLGMLCAPPAAATFSVVIADRDTGELALGTVSCLTLEDLMEQVPVIVVGKGVGAVQAFGDGDGIRRPIIGEGLRNGVSPDEILALLAKVPGHDYRQYGIVNTDAGAASFSGLYIPRWRGGTAGTTGPLAYAIQGNALAGQCVLERMEAAIMNTPGDVPTRLMAAMQAAFESGGDGRCSCSTNHPDECDCPPPLFEKVGHIGCMIVARSGDVDDKACDGSGCADGDYFMKFNVAGQQNGDPDPVQQLQAQYSLWRSDHVGRPDAVHSTCSFEPHVIPANGVSTSTIKIRFRDWRGVTASAPLAELSVEHASGSAGRSSIDAVIDNGDGTAIVKLTAGQSAGVDRFRIVADDGIRPVTLTPNAAFEYFPLGDIDGDGVVSTADIIEILVALGECPNQPNACPADLDADGMVGFTDLLIVLQNWG